MMLTVQQLRQAAAQSGVRDIRFIETEVILTILLQLFHEKGLTDHIAFKGGTFLRKMVFGPAGRISTDLDFTRRTDVSIDDLSLAMMEALVTPYRGLTFALNRSKDWYETDDGCSCNPTVTHAGNDKGLTIKIQISTREAPILPVIAMPQLEQGYFQHLGFAPAAIPSLAVNEVIAEKIRAASQRSKIRDLYDLSEIGRKPLNKEQIRTLAVIKMWNTRGHGLDVGRFMTRIRAGEEYDLSDLQALLRKDQNPDLKGMIGRVVDNFQFLGQLTEVERGLTTDGNQRQAAAAAALVAQVRAS